ncbi:MAG: tetratricopeptide repeat protein [Pseudomonadales bacterium]|nr:tetratricopeptide repeat protein [Pseudomonadales bacterium]
MAASEEEQLEALKHWWDENGKSLLIGVVLALAAVFGYQAWQNNRQETGEAASAIYEDLLDAVVTNSPFEEVDPDKLSTGKFLANRLKEEHPDTSYAHFAALFLAKIAIDEGKPEDAEKEIQWSLDHGLDESLVPIAKIRLAKVKLAEGKKEEALAALGGIEGEAYRASYEEVAGDIHYALGETELAREAYQRAVNALDPGESRPFLQMKLDDLEAPQMIIPADEAGMGASAQENMQDTAAESANEDK